MNGARGRTGLVHVHRPASRVRSGAHVARAIQHLSLVSRPIARPTHVSSRCSAAGPGPVLAEPPATSPAGVLLLPSLKKKS